MKVAPVHTISLQAPSTNEHQLLATLLVITDLVGFALFSNIIKLQDALGTKSRVR